jgi:hypothetical protein
VLQIGKKLRKILVRRGYEVVMTRTTMEFDSGTAATSRGAKFCNRHDAALMVRVHADGVDRPLTPRRLDALPAWHKGWTSDILPESREAAARMQKAYCAKTARRPRARAPRRPDGLQLGQRAGHPRRDRAS